tara:strand:- start:1270 stop:2232 length:963 start_codon:yes stop_codon:yes gene_type:complete
MPAGKLKVGVFNSTLSDTDSKRQVFKDFAKGVISQGDEAFVQENLEYKECDVAVIFGAVRDKPSKAHLHKLKAEIIEKHKPNNSLLVFDNAVIGRKINEPGAAPYYRLGINGFLNDEADFNNINSKPERWEKIKKDLGQEIKPWRKRGSYILLILQKMFDASLRGIESERPRKHIEWALNVIDEIHKTTDRPIIIRPHPLSLSSLDELEWMKILKENIPIRKRVTIISVGTISDVLRDCWACVTYTSGSAVDALLDGIPTVTYDGGSMGYPICEHDCKNIENLSMPDRKQWLYNLAYTQWHVKEMSTGEPWLHLRDRIGK